MPFGPKNRPPSASGEVAAYRAGSAAVSGDSLLVYTAAPSTESYEKLQLLAVIGAQRLT